MQRLFLAIPIVKSYANNLSLYQHALYQRLSKQTDNLRLTPRENLHVTLVFIGNTPSENVSAIIKEVQKATKELQPFTLTPKSIMQLPSDDKARAVCLTFNDSKEFNDLQSKLYEAVHSVQPTQPPKPIIHTTLMRASKLDISDNTPLPDVELSPLSVDTFTLFESKLNRNGSTYQPLETFNLK